MPATRQGSFALTAFLSFVYGFAGFVILVHHTGLEPSYRYDFLSYWVLAPLGAFCGFTGATWVHELGHFFAARGTGAVVYSIQIGTGSLLKTFHLMGTPCNVHTSLRGGLVSLGLTTVKGARAKIALITAAGPLASIVVAGGSAAALFSIYPLIEPSPSLWNSLFAFLSGWAFPCLLFLTSILLPYRYTYRGRIMKTDALVLLTIPWLTDAEITEKVRSTQALLTRRNELLQMFREELDPNVKSLEQALTRAEEAPDNYLALSTAAVFLRRAQDSRALAYYRKLLDLPLTPEMRMKFIDVYVTYSLDLGTISLHPEEMEKLSCELLASKPADISIVGTRGSVLVDLGRTEEGKTMLQEVLMKTETSLDKAYSHAFLALAAKAEGNLDLAREHAIKARQADAACPALKRISDLLP